MVHLFSHCSFCILTRTSCQSFPRACLKLFGGSPGWGKHGAVAGCLAIANQLLDVQESFAGRAVCLENSPANSYGAAMWKEHMMPFRCPSQTILDCSLPSLTFLQTQRRSNGQAASLQSQSLLGLGRALQVFIWRHFVLMHWISSLATIVHIYLPDPTHCEGWDHTKLSAITHQSRGSCLQDRESTSLSLLLSKNHMVSVLKVNTFPSVYTRFCCDICLYLCRTNGDLDLKWTWSIKDCSFLHPASSPGSTRNQFLKVLWL